MKIVVVFSLLAVAAAKPLIEEQLNPVNYIRQSYPINDELQQQLIAAPASGNLKTSRNLVFAFPITVKNKFWENLRSMDLEEPVKPKVKYVERSYPLPLNSQDERYIQPITDMRLGRLYPYSEGITENYQYVPYNYKNIMQYPSRSLYFLRNLNKPEMSKPQPKITYDSQDFIYQHDVNQHHVFNNIHDFNQKHIIRKLDYDSTPYVAYSPMQYSKMNKYSKSLDQEYVQPWNSNYYNKYWEVDYIRNYLDNLNTEIPSPYMYRRLEQPYGYLNFDYVKPVISRNLETQDVYPVIKSLNVGYIQPVISKGSKHSLVGQGEPIVELKNKTPEITEHQGGLPLGTIPHEGRRQEIQLSANIGADTVQAEDHISQQPIHKQTRTFPYYQTPV